MSWIRTVCAATVTAVTLTQGLLAQDSAAVDPHAALPERPTVATHAYTVAPGYIELEAGGQLERSREGSLLEVPVLWKIGVASRLQFDFAPEYTRERDQGTLAEGWNDLAFGVKWHLPVAVSLFGDVAIQTTVTVPSAPVRTVGTGTTGVSLLGISSHRWGEYELDVNAGVTRQSGDGSRVPRVSTLWTASLAAPIAGELDVAVELFGYPGTSGPAGALPAVGFLVGPTYAVRPWLVLDAGVMLNVEHQGANTGYAGMTWNVGRL